MKLSTASIINKIITIGSMIGILSMSFLKINLMVNIGLFIFILALIFVIFNSWHKFIDKYEEARKEVMIWTSEWANVIGDHNVKDLLSKDIEVYPKIWQIIKNNKFAIEVLADSGYIDYCTFNVKKEVN